ncbi:Major intrinsic protein [Macleaya cordata]|uniref:Major intrinsic protein n=1 Tax=Macleaya cordata TaxID=56857 RepID=A0A200Q360_MACCD|nr:Major intrinsic protein [Macleaya cordata]
MVGNGGFGDEENLHVGSRIQPFSSSPRPLIEEGKNADGKKHTPKTLSERLGLEEFLSLKVWRASVAELIGTAVLVFAIDTIVISSYETQTKTPNLIMSFVIFLSVTVLLLATFPISGGHINPVVTFSAALIGLISVARATIYIIAQCAGAVVGALALQAIVSSSIEQTFSLGGCTLTVIGPGPNGPITIGIETVPALWLEIICTFVFLFASVWIAFDDRQAKAHGPVVVCSIIGLIVGLMVFVSTTVTAKKGYAGVGMNPARCLGPALIRGGHLWDGHWVFWVGPTIACVAFYLIEEEKNDDHGKERIPKTLSEKLGLEEFLSVQVWRASIAELIGTAILVFAIDTIVISSFETQTKTPNLLIPFFIFLSVTVLLLATSPISGGHINPVVTFSAALIGLISVARATIYIVAQCAGAVLGALALKAIVSSSIDETFSPGGCTLTVIGPGSNGTTVIGIETGPALLLEIICTFVFLFASIWNAFDSRQAKAHGPLVVFSIIGLVVGLMMFVSTTVTTKKGYAGAGLNPARCIGPALVRGGHLWDGHWAFWVGPTIACVAFYLYTKIIPRHHFHASREGNDKFFDRSWSLEAEASDQKKKKKRKSHIYKG